jgi:hypothetical protein
VVLEQPLVMVPVVVIRLLLVRLLMVAAVAVLAVPLGLAAHLAAVLGVLAQTLVALRRKVTLAEHQLPTLAVVAVVVVVVLVRPVARHPRVAMVALEPSVLFQGQVFLMRPAAVVLPVIQELLPVVTLAHPELPALVVPLVPEVSAAPVILDVMLLVALVVHLDLVVVADPPMEGWVEAAPLVLQS